MRLYHLLILSIIIYCSTRIAVLAVPFFNKHSCSTSSSSSHSSLLLQHHRTIYTNRRPHDTSLYDILNVRPNATLAEIQKSWRRKSLLWHPDKVKRMCIINDYSKCSIHIRIILKVLITCIRLSLPQFCDITLGSQSSRKFHNVFSSFHDEMHQLAAP